MDTPNALTAIIAGIVAALVALWILALAYDALVCQPRLRRRVLDQQRRGCRCPGAWDGKHEESCPFYEEAK